MIYYAKVLHLNNEIEEEAVLQINGVELVCFACVCPYEIKEGQLYPVELHPVVFDDYVVTELSNSSDTTIDRVGKGFQYLITGRLIGQRLECGELILEDEVLQRDFNYLDGKMIAIKWDRIDVEFLSQGRG